MRLLIGNKNYSSWSLRAWLPLRYSGIPFEEERVALYEPGYRHRILSCSPAGKVPVLIDEGVAVWESLAIGEYLAERFPLAGIWPKGRLERTVARTLSAEMHAGFTALRSRMPMNIRARFPGRGRTPEVEQDVARVREIWESCLARSGGPFLFCRFSFVDAMFAPVVTRFVTYAVELDSPLAQYAERIWTLPAMQEWRAAAEAETETIAEYEQPL